MKKGKLCFRNGDIAPQWPIELRQTGRDRFTVIYGLEVKERLNYGDAARALGGALMHALACEDKLDNREAP